MTTILLAALARVQQSKEADTDERGASAVEYGLLVAGIAAVIVAGVFMFGGFMAELFGTSCGTMADHVVNGNQTC